MINYFLIKQLSSFWLKLIVLNYTKYQLGRPSLGRLSRTSTWPPIIGKTFSNINLAADHWEDSLEHQLCRRSLGRLSRTSTWPPIIEKTFSNINLAANHWEDTLVHQLGCRSLEPPLFIYFLQWQLLWHV
ncbi:hypothetical protein BLOT_010476, partial [Blomia tropicalis]